MSALEHNPRDLGQLKHSLQQRLHEFARRIRLRLLLESTAQWVAIVVACALITFILDRTLRLSQWTRRGLLIVFVVTVIVQAWRRWLAPLRLKLTSDVMAAALEQKVRAPIAARVATVLELPGQAGSAGASSGTMIETAVLSSSAALDQIDFDSHLNDQRRRFALGALGITVLLVLILVVSFPGTAWLWAARLFGGSNRPWPQRTYLEVVGLSGDTLAVPRGEPFALRVSVRKGSETPELVSIRWKQRNASGSNVVLSRFGPTDFRYDFPAIQADVVFELSGGDDVVGPVTVHPIDRPKFLEMKLTAQHPTDRQPKVFSFSGEDAGDLSFLPLTRLELQLTANVPVAEARIKASTTQPSTGAVRRINDRQFAVGWQHASATQLEMELVSVEAGLVSVPAAVSIGLRSDKPPKVTLGYSGVRQRITPAATIPLMAEARDDYGVARIELQMKADLPDPDDPKRVRSSATTQPIFSPVTQPIEFQTEIRQPHQVSASELKLQAGHLLTITCIAADACYTGAQVVSARPVSFRVVRPEDLFKEILLRQQSERAKLRKQLEDARKLHDALAYGPTAQALPDLQRQHRLGQREINRIQTVLSDSLMEMRLNVLGTDAAYDLMERGILQPMKTLDTDLLNPQKEALDLLRLGDAPSLAAAVERQERIVTRIEEILKQMAQWDSFIDVINQLNEIIRSQSQVQQGTTQLKRDQVERAFER